LPDTAFPNNIIDLLEDRVKFYLPNHSVLKRALRLQDPKRCVGLLVADWTPDERSHQIGQQEPAVSRYLIRIQNMVKASDEVTGKDLFAGDAKTIRVLLYRDSTLHVGLAALTEELLGTREVAKRWGIGRQRFLNTELQSQWTYVAQTEFWLETESIQL